VVTPSGLVKKHVKTHMDKDQRVHGKKLRQIRVTIKNIIANGRLIKNKDQHMKYYKPQLLGCTAGLKGKPRPTVF
jgi:hypothetical protein